MPLVRETVNSLVKNVDTRSGEKLGSTVQSTIEAIFTQYLEATDRLLFNISVAFYKLFKIL